MGEGGSSWTVDGMLLFFFFFKCISRKTAAWAGKALGGSPAHWESTGLRMHAAPTTVASLKFLVSGKPEMLGAFFRWDQPSSQFFVDF